MAVKVLERKKGKLSIEVGGETHTLLNLLRENMWKAGASQADYIIRHPYASQPELIVRAKDPAKIMDEAAQMIISEARGFGKEFGRALKR